MTAAGEIPLAVNTEPGGERKLTVMTPRRASSSERHEWRVLVPFWWG